jgi:hypothetical protein
MAMNASPRLRCDIEDAPAEADVEVLPNGLEAFNESRALPPMNKGNEICHGKTDKRGHDSLDVWIQDCDDRRERDRICIGHFDFPFGRRRFTARAP